jgi:predicted nucleotidyltransferase
MEKMKNKESRSKAIEKFVKNAKELLSDDLIDILIYGSVVRGEAKSESDIDVIVIVRREEFKSQMKLASLAFDVLMDTGEYISVQAVMPEDFNRDTIFMRNVREEAISVA